MWAGSLGAGELKWMHCFTFTSIQSASQNDWTAFFQSTDALPQKIKGLTHVWYGKLTNPLNIFIPDQATNAKFRAGETKATGEFTRVPRDFGVCMEFMNEASFKSYGADPAHKDWVTVYSKVRQEETTTFNFMGK